MSKKKQALLLSAVTLSQYITCGRAFCPYSSPFRHHPNRDIRTYYTEEDEFDLTSSAEQTTSIRRLQFRGVSISPNGFLALLTPNTEDVIIPLRVSNDPNDSTSASSVESLTLIQLLSGIDMAGAVLPPNLLHHLVAFYCSLSPEGDDNSRAFKIMNKRMKESLGDLEYSEATSWQTSRVRYPQVQLRTVRLDLDENIRDGEDDVKKPIPLTFILECTVEGNPIHVPLRSESEESNFLEHASYGYTPATAAFLGLSLALRYKTPITIPTSFLRLFPPEDDDYPDFMPLDSLQRQNDFVKKDINKSFEANRLQGALKIAIQKGDVEAEKKIIEKLKEYDSFDDLLVLDSDENENDDINEEDKKVW
eukprot:CAMPEP_0172508802 /NCGR_PEP_ID=MMETSP1066-20121228/214948_1 /TAXON_ID=671091 /ORGANISM="Coscinodiscus wailesii, Strain CCMP2513" /LENGTH=363 /DNA_ID=CAMNT_0013286969 /DNA_START=47 /DNA_END=1135 /DNA_ORIENTATION=+